MTKIWSIVAGGALVLLLAASVIVALLESEEPFEAGTPEAGVQDYLRAVEEDEFEEAYRVLSAELKQDCPIDVFAGGTVPTRINLRDDRVTLVKTTTVGDTMFVTVRVTQFHGDAPLSTSESSFEQRFSLRQEEGEWRFTEYPWPFRRCGPFKPEPARRPLDPARAPELPAASPTPAPGA